MQFLSISAESGVPILDIGNLVGPTPTHDIVFLQNEIFLMQITYADDFPIFRGRQSPSAVIGNVVSHSPVDSYTVTRQSWLKSKAMVQLAGNGTLVQI